jgi:hypothetical protein
MLNIHSLFTFLVKCGCTRAGAAGVLGNIYAESNLNAIALERSFQKKLGYTDETYTEAVDNGSYKNFVHDSAGYGLVQWTLWSRKEGLLEYASSINSSIGDVQMQLDYIWKELQAEYKAVAKVLTTTNSVRDASDVFMLKYERPADQSEAAQQKRAKFGKDFYDEETCKQNEELEEEDSKQ